MMAKKEMENMIDGIEIEIRDTINCNESIITVKGNDSVGVLSEYKKIVAGVLRSTPPKTVTPPLKDATAKPVGTKTTKTDDEFLNQLDQQELEDAELIAEKPKKKVVAPVVQDDPDEETRCGLCDGEVWDNRETKTGRQPDFKCKECKAAAWLPKPGQQMKWKADSFSQGPKKPYRKY